MTIKKKQSTVVTRSFVAGPAFNGFRAPTFRFLMGLRQNNQKGWFEENRAAYEKHYLAPALAFIADFGPRLRKLSKTVNFVPKVNGSLFRVHRDVRFGKDKRPYKDHIDMWFWEGPDKSRSTPGFFLRLEPDRLLLGTGLYRFDKAQLQRYREAVVDGRKARVLQKAIDAMTDGPYQLAPPQRKRVPRGFDAEHPFAHLLLHDGLTVSWRGKPPRTVRSSAFLQWCESHYRAMLPIERWLVKQLAP